MNWIELAMNVLLNEATDLNWVPLALPVNRPNSHQVCVDFTSGKVRTVPHRKQVRRVHEPGHLHEFTFSCYSRKALLTNDDWRTRLARSIDEAGQCEQFDLVAFVFMPEHVHLLVHPRTNTPNLGRYLARIKQPFSREIKELLVVHQSPLVEQLTIRERPGKWCFRFWQEGGGYGRNLFSPDAVMASIDYIHNNPVKRGLCQRATDWTWSSARYYLLDPPRQQFPTLPHVQGPPGGFFD